MVLEIIVNGKDKSKIEQKNKKIDKKIKIGFKDYQNNEYSIYTYSNEYNHVSTASALSAIRPYLSNGINIIIVKDDSSSFFAKKLYPLINDFEINLRSYIYIKNSLSNDNSNYFNIGKLNEKTLGELMDLLFLDSNLHINIKQLLNKKYYTKGELINLINNNKDSILWDKLDVNSELSIIKEKNGEITKYRNDVMHMHFISYEDFKSAKTLFEEINELLEKSIIIAKDQPLTQEQSIAFIDQLSALDVLLNNSYIGKICGNALETAALNFSIVNELYQPNENILKIAEIINQAVPRDFLLNENIEKIKATAESLVEPLKNGESK